jgi:hypothetical protein
MTITLTDVRATELRNGDMVHVDSGEFVVGEVVPDGNWVHVVDRDRPEYGAMTFPRHRLFRVAGR